ncbi:MAG: hypothetical protein WBA07_20330 [Rivularia sp. (in: cyanobacteria)]
MTVVKYHDGNLKTNCSLKPIQAKQLIDRGINGCWYAPEYKWISQKQLRARGEKDIADRIDYLIKKYGDSKRFIVTIKENGNRLLNYQDTELIRAIANSQL